MDGKFDVIGILSDAHGNLRGFERGISLLREFGATQFIFLGDAVGYIPGSAVVKRCAGSKVTSHVSKVITM